MSLVEAARFHDRQEAEVATSFLRAQGIEASLADGVLATIDPMLWRAMGGLRVMVPASQEATARHLLASVRAGEYEIEGDAPRPNGGGRP